MNKEVTATGMDVKVTSAQSLLIDTASFTGYSTVALENDSGMTSGDYSSKAKAIVPTEATSGTGEVTFKRLTANDMKLVKDDGTINGDATKEATTEDYFHDSVYLKLTGQGEATTETITVSAKLSYTGSSEAKNIFKALHVGVIEKGKTAFIDFDMGSKALATYTDAQDLTTLTYNADATQFEVYAWLDGPDSDCFNANTGDFQDYTIELKFAIKEA